MRIGSGAHTYEWIDDWARIPETQLATTSWAHHDVVVTDSGQIVAFHQGDGTVLTFDRDGNLQDSWASGLIEAHQMTLVKEGGTEYLWIADNGAKRLKRDGYVRTLPEIAGRVIKTTLEGKTALNLARPEHRVYQEGGLYSPTSVAVNEERYGGNGDVWVTDGYGEGYVHRYDREGNYLQSINGEEGHTGRFGLPHAIWADTRKSEPELYVTDQMNHQIQVYDMDGKYKRVFGAEFLRLPGGFLTVGEFMFVIELRGRITVLGADDRLVCLLGDYDGVWEIEGWPNIPEDQVKPGKFIGPHGLAADADGNLYVAEWLIGGRMTKLSKT